MIKRTGLQGIMCIPIVVQPSLILSQRNPYSDLFLVLFLLSDQHQLRDRDGVCRSQKPGAVSGTQWGWWLESWAIC